MKRRISVCLISLLCLGLISISPGVINQAQAKDSKITVLSPMGTPPPIKSLAMAPRLDSLDGKTIYFVNDGYLNADVLLQQMIAWMHEKHPNVKTVYRRKKGGFLDEDPALWAEIKAKGDAMVMAIGH